jgi:hypothetical protein
MRGTKLPIVEAKLVMPLTTEQVGLIRDAMPARLRALVTFAAGIGLRQGECLGLTVDRRDFLRRFATVGRQLVTLAGEEARFGPPKTTRLSRSNPIG